MRKWIVFDTETEDAQWSYVITAETEVEMIVKLDQAIDIMCVETGEMPSRFSISELINERKIGYRPVDV